MKKVTLLLMVIALASFAGRRSKKAEVPLMANASDSFSYAIGMDIANSLAPLSQEINLVFLQQALAAASSSDSTVTPLLTKEQATAITEAMFSSLQEKEVAKQDSLNSASLKAGEAFLLSNKAKEGVTTTESGLQYKIITKGAGAQPTTESSVTVHYEGKTIDGKIFDSSKERGEPATFSLQQVIPGWTELLLTMHEGDIVQGFIPSYLAYGPQGAGEAIAPNSTLIFEVELIKVNSNSADEAVADTESDSTAVQETPAVK